MRAVISAEYPVLIQVFISDEKSRYYLNGFCVRPDRNKGLQIVATDGHRLGVFYDSEGIWDGPADGEMIVKLDKPALTLLKETSRPPIPRWLVVEGTIENNQAMVIQGDPKEQPLVLGTFPKVLIEGTYPDYRRVVPDIKKRQIVPQSFQAKYIQAFAKIVDKTNGGRIRVISEVPNGPALILTSRDDFFGVLMPFSPGWEACNTYPEFWTRQPEKPAEPKRRGRPPKKAVEVAPEIPSGAPVPDVRVPERTAEVITLTPKSNPPETESEPTAA